jgi:hypothetical protein
MNKFITFILLSFFVATNGFAQEQTPYQKKAFHCKTKQYHDYVLHINMNTPELVDLNDMIAYGQREFDFKQALYDHYLDFCDAVNSSSNENVDTQYLHLSIPTQPLPLNTLDQHEQIECFIKITALNNMVLGYKQKFLKIDMTTYEPIANPVKQDCAKIAWKYKDYFLAQQLKNLP